MSTRERRQLEAARVARGIGPLLTVLLEVANDGTHRGQPLADAAFVRRLREILDMLHAAAHRFGGAPDAESVAFVVKEHLPLPQPDDALVSEAAREPYVWCATALHVYLTDSRFAAFRLLARCRADDCRRWFFQRRHRGVAFCRPACSKRVKREQTGARVRAHRSRRSV